MDSGTASHPPCPMCDPSILPEGYDPIGPEAAMVRPDGSFHAARSGVKVYVDGVDVTNQAKEADPERGVVVAYHRVMAPKVTEITGSGGTKWGRVDWDKFEMVRHVCNRDNLPPGVHPDLRPKDQHACTMLLTGEVVVIDQATGVAPVFAEPEDVGSSV